MKKTPSLFDSNLLQTAARDALKRLSPRYQLKNPVMFVVWLGSLLTTGLFVQALAGQGAHQEDGDAERIVGRSARFQDPPVFT